MRSKIKLFTVNCYVELESDETDRISICPEEFEWAKGLAVNDFKEELERKGELVEWEEEFIDG